MKSLLSFIAVAILFLTSCNNKKENRFYPGNPEPLIRNACIKLPLGSVRPEGWLLRQLQIQADGLTGHLDDFWPDLVNSSWRGGDGEAWERGPYYLDGLVPLAYILNDEKLIRKSQEWIEAIIASSSDSGWFGPAKNRDRWPLAVACKVLMHYHEATSDPKSLETLTKYFRYLHDAPPDWPDKDWRGVRAMENAVTGYWLYRKTREPWILETLKSIQENSFDWTSYYEEFPWDSAALAEKRIPVSGAPGKTAHVVNNAMAIKYPGLWYQQSKDERFRNATFDGIRKYDMFHGQAGGRFSGDEHLSGKSPDRGTELCSVVEYMFSLSELYQVFGDNSLADRLELLAFNSLPGTCTPDMWAHQYDQQANQVLVDTSGRNWSSNSRFSNIYGLMPNFACCLANMHQGWPDYIRGMWMATNDNGLIAAAYGPSKVTAMVGKGREVTITEQTEYPFKGDIILTMNTDKDVSFPLYLRIPGWADAVVSWKGKSQTFTAGSTARLTEKWKKGDQVIIKIPMNIRFETRFNEAVSILRGPLYFSLRIDRKYESTRINYDNYGYMGTVDWQIRPASAWNYGLLLDRQNPGNGFTVTENIPGEYPFADTGDMIWSPDSVRHVEYRGDPAVVLKTRGIKIDGWTMKDNSADIPPLSPVKASGSPEEIILVPYGSAKLRITEFPVVDLEFMQKTN